MGRLKLLGKFAGTAAAAFVPALSVGVSTAQSHRMQTPFEMVELQETQPRESDIREWEHTHPLHFALRVNEYDRALEAMRLMTAAEARDPWGRTPLSLAADDESAAAYDMVRALLQYGANPNGRDGDGLTPLHYAARSGNLAVVEMLVNRGAKIDAVIEDGEGEDVTPLHLAYEKRRTRVIEFMENHGAKISDERRKELEIQAKADEYYERMTATVPKEVTPKQEPRWRLKQSIMAQQMAVIESGHLTSEERAVMDAFYTSYIESLGKEQPDDVSFLDWIRDIHNDAIQSANQKPESTKQLNL